MQVELDVFSGRPNPRWNLTYEEIDKFLNALKDLPSVRMTVDRAKWLGYRGMIVSGKEIEIRSYNKVSVYNGTILAEGSKETKVFKDENRELERWLLETGMRVVERGILEVILSNIEAR